MDDDTKKIQVRLNVCAAEWGVVGSARGFPVRFESAGFPRG
jgi:hypothetical protein